ncbi:UDP-N-acetylmuramoylalanine--D-glutamate ligase [Terriglobus roseus DSM 18391]|uniref:UDP-N-acetylmuramoylalanine--D-glutamate ligase n=1 Tax=Terriglobus roseus (strain DSM 18391 / NRRL B-41598 / KBS 63) TaxID=926566 RepID=I3ZK92_TERRK|nr:UDP-N-acetylmuramoyl-L-alanine--D-glutamate ligase [Terriglobus roseus]AFL89660.1 UDP-N-acetylmuramoylalanine--D-glutamate ligase [Terriglobus roseus DSM 18391]
MDLKNKRVLVVGLGKSGVSAALYLRRLGARVTVSDARAGEALAKEIPALLDAGVMVETGGHGVLTFRRQDLIVVSPGVPLSTPEIQQVMALGMPLIGEVELAFQGLRGRVVAITGSNGKTTTTSLVGHILEHAGLETKVGGNIGLPVVELVEGSTEKTWSVLEVSSFQLETIETFRPHIAAVLNITPDHLDRHGSFENYAAAKARITENQTAEDFLVLNAEDKPTQMVAAKTKPQIYWFSGVRRVKQGAFVHADGVYFLAKEGGTPEPVMPVAEIPLPGAHNVENVLAAIAMARLAGVSAEVVREAVGTFTAVEHRLQFVRSVRGVDYYNDSKATNVDATAKALASFAGGVRVILGGKDKGSDYTELLPLLKERTVAVYTIGAAAEIIAAQIGSEVSLTPAGTLAEAVRMASAEAKAGETVLLAPACASFDQFTSYEDRGRVFMELVAGL